MAQAPAYNPATDFSDDELNNAGGRSTVRTANLDAELDAVAVSVNALRANQSLNQRDDGEIRDGRVKLFTLGQDVRALLASGNEGNPRGPWVTATEYAFKDLVSEGGNTYICVVAHTSGTFATDLAAVRWLLFSLSAAPSATQVTFTPTTNIAATNVQAAIEESDSENRAALAAAVSALTAQRERQTAIAGQTVFDLVDMTYTPGVDSMEVSVNGIQIFDFLETSATRVTLTSGVDAGDEVSFKAGLASAPVISSDAAAVSYAPAGPGAVASNVQTKLREWVSVRDFGAVGGSEESAKFQAAADSLGSTGGWILVPPGDYSATDPSLLTLDDTTTDKMITWVAFGATLPDNMPGLVMKSGEFMQDEGSSGRPGKSYLYLKSDTHYPDPSQVSQQDNVIFIEMNVPDHATSANEYRAYACNVESASTDPDASIRGFYATVIGADGSSAKLRAIRTLTLGRGSHDGLVVGAMHAAARDDPAYVSGVAGPYPNQDYAIIGQVGPGIRGVFQGQGFEGAERPQTLLQQGVGAQALLPEVAVLDLHAGGNGVIMRVLVSESDGTVLAQITKACHVQMPSFYSGSQTIADDAAITITPPNTSGVIEVYAEATSTSFGRRFYRVGGSPAMAAAYTGATFASTTGTLAGTTGSDTFLTISAKTDGTIDIENRTGASRLVVWHFTAR